jgi:hypothetical protein
VSKENKDSWDFITKTYVYIMYMCIVYIYIKLYMIYFIFTYIYISYIHIYMDRYLELTCEHGRKTQSENQIQYLLSFVTPKLYFKRCMTGLVLVLVSYVHNS